MFLQNCQAATSAPSSLLVITFPRFLYARAHHYSRGNSALSPSLPLSFSRCFFFFSLSGNYSKWVSLKGGWQAAFGTVLTKNPFIKEALVSMLWTWANQIISLSVSEEKSDPGMRVKPESADRLTALLGQPVLADWKNAEGKITCLAPDGINILFFFFFKYIHTSMFIIFCLKLFAYLIYSLMLSGQYLKHSEICANAIKLQGLEAK